MMWLGVLGGPVALQNISGMDTFAMEAKRTGVVWLSLRDRMVFFNGVKPFDASNL